jgi:hypothetical protein
MRGTSYAAEKNNINFISKYTISLIGFSQRKIHK